MRSISMVLATMLAAAAFVLSASAQEPATTATPPAMPAASAPEVVKTASSEMPATGTPSLTRADVEAWLDGFMPYALQRGDIAGGVVVVVKDGQILASKGYGYADVDARTPVDPAATLFRPGSVSKLFTWTAVMQLVEQGKIDLDADINTYLDFKIPARDGKAVTMRNVMTHTSGMEEYARALITSDADAAAAMPLEVYLKQWVPKSIFAPGSTPAYSNYAASVAGYIVQRLSGQSFDDYIDQHIFAPLNMKHSTFRQPLPEALKGFMSNGYELASDAKPKGFEFVISAPAGSLSAAGEDMGNFMIAHLQNGAFGSNRILSEKTAHTMHETALDMIPPLNRMLLGFYETNINGHRSISHAGDTQWFHSQLNLFPDDGIGLFLSVNSPGKEGAAHPLRMALFQEFADRYLPGAPKDGTVDAETANQHAKQMAGIYENSRRSDSGFVTMANLAEQMKIVATDKGSIMIPAFIEAGGQPKKWKEIAPYVWRDVHGSDRVAAKVEDGRVVRFSTDPYSPFMVFEPVPWWRSSGWLLPMVIGGMSALLLTVLAWPISALVRRRYGVRYELTGRDAKAHRRVRIAALIVLAVIFAAIGLLVAMFSDFDNLSPKNDVFVHLLRLLAAIVLPIGAIVGAWNAFGVLSSRRRWTAKLWSIVLAASFIVLLWAGYAFSLMGYSAFY